MFSDGHQSATNTEQLLDVAVVLGTAEASRSPPSCCLALTTLYTPPLSRASFHSTYLYPTNMARQRDVLPRLNIPASLNMQQPMQAMYSPALPTSIQQGFHAPLPMQTPMQPYFNPHMGPPTARPIHHAAHASMAQLAAAGIHPPNGFPITPLGGGHFPRPSMQMNGPPHGRNRRQLSVGGPPKAVLGGPQRKLSPLPPPTAAAATSPSPAPPPKKKMPVNLPKETIRAEDGSVIGHAPWARLVADAPPIPPAPLVQPVETNTKEAYPADGWRYLMPSTVDVFLPGKVRTFIPYSSSCR